MLSVEGSVYFSGAITEYIVAWQSEELKEDRTWSTSKEAFRKGLF